MMSFVLKNKFLSDRFVFATIAAAVCLHGCTLESLPDYGSPCPPDSSQGKLAYIIADDNYCKPGEECYANSFEYNVCPGSYPSCYRDSDNNYYCRQTCPAGMIACNGKCIDPLSDSAFCGAKGSCFGNDKDAGDFMGVACKSYQSCARGQCITFKCEDNQHEYGDDCEDDSLQNCGSHGYSCETLGGWLSGACDGGRCVADACADPSLLVNGKCEAKHDCKTVSAWCSDDGITRLYCNGDDVLQEPCNNGERCFDGQCETITSCNAGDPPSCFGDETILSCGDDLSLYKNKCPDNYKCYNGACFHQSLCQNNICHDPAPLGEACATNTFEDICNPGNTGIIRCAYDAEKDKDVYQLTDCSPDGKICKDAKCVCDPKQTPQCLNTETARTCQADGNFLDVPCPAGDICNRGICQTPTGSCNTSSDCSDSHACIENKCVFTPRCFPGITDNVCANGKTQIKRCNPKGDYEFETCDYDKFCNDDSGMPECVSKKGKSCDDKTFQRKCLTDPDGNQYLEWCSNSEIAVSKCSLDNYCTEIDGIARCSLKCDEDGDTACLLTAGYDKPFYGVCRETVDAGGAKRLVYQKHTAYCHAEGYTSFCIFDSNKNAIEFNVQCSDEVTPSQCLPQTGLCAGFASCSQQSAKCDGAIASNCIPNPSGDGFILLQNDCGARQCDILTPRGDANTPVARCYEDKTYTEYGTKLQKACSTFGLCSDDGKIQRCDDVTGTAYVETCAKPRVETKTEAGHTYCYCP